MTWSEKKQETWAGHARGRLSGPARRSGTGARIRSLVRGGELRGEAAAPSRRQEVDEGRVATGAAHPPPGIRHAPSLLPAAWSPLQGSPALRTATSRGPLFS